MEDLTNNNKEINFNNNPETNNQQSSAQIAASAFVSAPQNDVKKTTPIFAYSKNTQNPYLPKGYVASTPINMPNADSQQSQQTNDQPSNFSAVPNNQPQNLNVTANAQAQDFGSIPNNQVVNSNVVANNQAQSFSQIKSNAFQSQSSNLSFTNHDGTQVNQNIQANTNNLSNPAGEQEANNLNGFELVGNKATQNDIMKSRKKIKLKKRTENRMCGHFAWIFSIINLFICLALILCNLLLKQSDEEVQETILVTLKNFLDSADYVTLIALALTMISVINSIIQITIANNKYSKFTLIIVISTNVLTFIYLYCAGFVGQTVDLIAMAIS